MWARLVRHRTADGLVEMVDEIPLGMLYRIDPERAEVVLLTHDATGHGHLKVMVPDLDRPGQSLPLELLEVITPVKSDSAGG